MGGIPSPLLLPAIVSAICIIDLVDGVSGIVE